MIIFLTALAGCSIREEAFPHRFAELNCARHWECDRGSYELLYWDHFDCVRENERTFTEVKAFEEEYGCTYDPEAAATAYDDLNDMTCEEWHSGELLLGFTAIWHECE
jgi:hypothetical protein